MHQAIPYSSWRPLHNPTTHFTPLPLISHSHKNCDTINTNNNKSNNNNDISSVVENEKMVLNMVHENAVIVIARRGCCMSHVVKRLLLALGVNPAVYEVEEKDEEGVVKQLEATICSDDDDDDGISTQHGKLQFPAVFIGGKLFGGLDKIMATHISGELVPILKQAGALWL